MLANVFCLKHSLIYERRKSKHDSVIQCRGDGEARGNPVYVLKINERPIPFPLSTSFLFSLSFFPPLSFFLSFFSF